MLVHRSAHARNFTVLPNGLLQDRRLSYTARGLLTDLLSRPDGWREDGRAMADSSPQGRGAIRKALKELTEAGYYRVVKRRMEDGRIRSEAHVFDTPQLEAPGVPRPASGSAKTGVADVPLVKDLVEEPSLPNRVADEPSSAAGAREEPGREVGHQTDELDRSAALTLFRVIKSEPRLHLGRARSGPAVWPSHDRALAGRHAPKPPEAQDAAPPHPRAARRRALLRRVRQVPCPDGAGRHLPTVRRLRHAGDRGRWRCCGDRRRGRPRPGRDARRQDRPGHRQTTRGALRGCESRQV
ncbi:hypothetical protein P3T36_001956 [Kitasatospora sp. MAP12-15]|nr:hypothetical protein [Kitasatospora sp. MAP12-44]